MIGKTPDEMPAVTVPDDAPYTIDGIYWWNDSSGEWLDSSDKFEAGKYYSCQFYVKPNDGYVFAGSPTIYINGGTIRVNGQSAIDYDGYAEYTGGTIIINVQTVDSIPNQMMGGRGGMGDKGGRGAKRSW